MTYTFPDSLAPLRDFMRRQGVDVRNIRSERQAAFFAQSLAKTRFRFPADRFASLFPVLLAIQEKVTANVISERFDAPPVSAWLDRRSAVTGAAASVQPHLSTVDSKPGAIANLSPRVNGPNRSTSGPVGLVLYADGCCEPNPGPGGWGVAVYRDGLEIHAFSGGEPDTTNNRMELTAALEALRWIAGNVFADPLPRLLTDSRYVVDGCNDWRSGWKRQGWKRGKKPVANVDLWRCLDAALTAVPIRLEWVKGHAGVTGNERADELAEQGRASSCPLGSDNCGNRPNSSDSSFRAALIEQQLAYPGWLA